MTGETGTDTRCRVQAAVLALACAALVAVTPLGATPAISPSLGQHEGPHAVLAPAADAAAEREKDPDRKGRTISLRSGFSTQFDAYLAGPADATLGVLLVHDRWGLNRAVTDWADRIAGLGHRVLAVDLYDGRSVGKPRHGIEVWRAVDPVWTEANLNAALEWLRQSHTRIVVIGWGKGIGPVGELARRTERQLSGLVLYFDDETAGEARHLPAQPAMPVLEVTVARSLAHPARDPARPGAGAREAWDATRDFLARFGGNAEPPVSTLSFE